MQMWESDPCRGQVFLTNCIGMSSRRPKLFLQRDLCSFVAQGQEASNIPSWRSGFSLSCFIIQSTGGKIPKSF